MSFVKNPSDEVSPDIATPNAAVPAPKRKTLGDYVALAIATCGVGYAPIAPGTMGSLVGVGIYLLLRHETINVYVFDLGDTFFSAEFATDGAGFLLIPVLLIVVTVLSLIGIWAGSRAERLFGKKDPGAVVIDEVVGQLLTFSFMPHFIGATGILIGFVLFRLFDIVKPYPIRKLEKLPSGLGIVVDDLAAGFYAGMALLIIDTLFKLRVWHP